MPARDAAQAGSGTDVNTWKSILQEAQSADIPAADHSPNDRICPSDRYARGVPSVPAFLRVQPAQPRGARRKPVERTWTRAYAPRGVRDGGAVRGIRHDHLHPAARDRSKAHDSHQMVMQFRHFLSRQTRPQYPAPWSGFFLSEHLRTVRIPDETYSQSRDGWWGFRQHRLPPQAP